MKKHLQALFLDQLSDIYYAEKQLTKALPKMVKAATHEELAQAFQKHLEETEDQVRKLEKVFQAFDRPAKTEKCDAIEGLIEEADKMASDHKGSPTINPALIAAGQKVEHYEIATYGCLQAWASLLGNDEAAEILGQILEEEKSADEKLTELANDRCNRSALEGEDEDEGDDTGPAPERKGRVGSAARA